MAAKPSPARQQKHLAVLIDADKEKVTRRKGEKRCHGVLNSHGKHTPRLLEQVKPTNFADTQIL
ncbi:hypothetical protein [Pseudomonas sp. HMWF032]|uniref:hypothetical protein n=1 Tax=Pseudomonas sp. HMWF032 TaxID=2056866 RepID=UPI0011B23505|nr:hypothetical protein [Pseudomonas sp. HMWF032]